MTPSWIGPPLGFRVVTNGLEDLQNVPLGDADASEVERLAQTTDLLVLEHLLLDLTCHLDCPAHDKEFVVYATTSNGEPLSEPTAHPTLDDSVAGFQALLERAWDLGAPLRAAFKRWK